MNAGVWQIAIAIAASLAVLWLMFLALLCVARPKGTSLVEVLRVVPDTLVLVKRLVMDPSLPRAVRWRLVLLIAYLATPFDLVPDFIPILGQLDDVILMMITLRYIVRKAGGNAVEKHWPGTDAGLAALWKIAGLPGASRRIDRS
jgi:uncharacterized membrane protein YkvA (DUF1232 family)